MQAHIDHTLHVVVEQRHVEDQLSLHKIGSSGDLFSEAKVAQVDWVGEGICGSADKQAWTTARNLLATLEVVFVAHILDHTQQLHGIDVVDVLSALVIAERLVVAAEAEHIGDAMSCSAQ